MMLVIGIPPCPTLCKRTRQRHQRRPDSIPAPASRPAGRTDLMAEARRDMRTDRGRVLYGAGHAPRDTAAASARTLPKHYCPEQRVVQGHGTPAPNS